MFSRSLPAVMSSAPGTNVLAGLELEEADRQTGRAAPPQQVTAPGHLTQRTLHSEVLAAPWQRTVQPRLQAQPSQQHHSLQQQGASVSARVESVIEGVLCDLLSGQLPRIALPAKEATSSQASTQDASQASQQAIFSQSQPSQLSLPSQTSSQTAGEGRTGQPGELQSQGRSKRAMTVDPGNQKVTDRFCRALVLLDAVHEKAVEAGSQTQRDLYYQVKGPLFKTPVAVANGLRDIREVLDAPRAALNITTASGKGRVSGSLQILNPKSGRWLECESSTFAVPGDVHDIRALRMRSRARHVLIVEKDAAFRSLCDAPIWRRLPLILVTAQGMPDYATRAFLQHLDAQLPGQLTFLGLVDWNPSGVLILANYKAGSAKRCADFSLPQLQWLGVHSAMLERDCDPDDLQPLSDLDVRKLQKLLNDDARVPDAWRPELEAMLEGGCKCEIEAAHKLRGMHAFCGLLIDAIATHAML